ncbi:hypothetical protein PAXINDRAFT_11229 [Paxillus involutus ATCC 200175]|nr:hypothetical protein PAXINDRAFT_11229 [Paxillus involutus ATCC 200175]
MSLFNHTLIAYPKLELGQFTTVAARIRGLLSNVDLAVVKVCDNTLTDSSQDWKQYAQKSFGCDPHAAAGDINSKVPHAGLLKYKTRLDPVQLVTRHDGTPWVMDIKQVGLDSLKNIVQEYFMYHYRIACSIPNTAVPWGEVSRDQNKFILPTYLPLNFKVANPSKMYKKDVHA